MFFPTPAVAMFVFRCCSARVLLCRRGLVHKVRRKGQKLLSYPPDCKMKHEPSLFFPFITSSQRFLFPPHCCAMSLLLSHVLIFQRFNKTSLTLLEDWPWTCTKHALSCLYLLFFLFLAELSFSFHLKLLTLMHLTSCRTKSCSLFSLACLSSFSHTQSI